MQKIQSVYFELLEQVCYLHFQWIQFSDFSFCRINNCRQNLWTGMLRTFNESTFNETYVSPFLSMEQIFCSVTFIFIESGFIRITKPRKTL